MDRIKVRVEGVCTTGLSYFCGGSTIQDMPMMKKIFEPLKRIKMMQTYSAKKLSIMQVAGNLLFRISAWRTSNPLAINNQINMDIAYRTSFLVIRKLLTKEILMEEEIGKLTYLTRIYIESLSERDFWNKKLPLRKM